MDDEHQYFKKNIILTKNPHDATCQVLTAWWKVMLTWCYHGNSKLVTLELHNNCFYIIVSELHKLYIYMVSHMVNYICCISCNLCDSTDIHWNMLSCNELQTVMTIQKPSCKASCKSLRSFIMFGKLGHYLKVKVWWKCLTFWGIKVGIGVLGLRFGGNH
jgi:hypothetical protein